MARITVQSTSLFNTPGMLRWALNAYEQSIGKAKNQYVTFVNELLFRGRDEGTAREVCKGLVPLDYTEDTVSFEYNGGAFKTVQITLTLERDEPIAQEEMTRWKSDVESAILADVDFGPTPFRRMQVEVK